MIFGLICKFQFGTERLADFKRAGGKRFTMNDFKADTDLQDRVAARHVMDIDESMDGIGDKASSFDGYGLRAITYLAAMSGMKKYVKSEGINKLKFQSATSLQDYYEK